MLVKLDTLFDIIIVIIIIKLQVTWARIQC